MKNSLCLISALLLFGCQSQNLKQEYFIPPPPPTIKPPTPPPSFIPSIKRLAEIQINPIPHPFSINGEKPFAVWVDGKRLNLNNSEIIKLTNSLNIKYKTPSDTAEIHQGQGWQYPLKIDEQQNSHNRKYR
jgi:hypothetical protein